MPSRQLARYWGTSLVVLGMCRLDIGNIGENGKGNGSQLQKLDCAKILFLFLAHSLSGFFLFLCHWASIRHSPGKIGGIWQGRGELQEVLHRSLSHSSSVDLLPNDHPRNPLTPTNRGRISASFLQCSTSLMHIILWHKHCHKICYSIFSFNWQTQPQNNSSNIFSSFPFTLFTARLNVSFSLYASNGLRCIIAKFFFLAYFHDCFSIHFGEFSTGNSSNASFRLDFKSVFWKKNAQWFPRWQHQRTVI